MDEHAEPGTEPIQSPAEDPDLEPVKPSPMGRNFYLVMALIGLMLFLIVFFNVPATRASAAATLVTNNWTLASYATTPGVLVPVMDSTQVTARFGRDGIVRGSAGCNGYTGTYTIKEYALSITALGSTKMSCPASGVMIQETRFLSDLGNASAIRIYDPNLNVYDGQGKLLLVFGSGSP